MNKAVVLLLKDEPGVLSAESGLVIRYAFVQVSPLSAPSPRNAAYTERVVIERALGI